MPQTPRRAGRRRRRTAPVKPGHARDSMAKADLATITPSTRRVSGLWEKYGLQGHNTPWERQARHRLSFPEPLAAATGTGVAVKPAARLVVTNVMNARAVGASRAGDGTWTAGGSRVPGAARRRGRGRADGRAAPPRPTWRRGANAYWDPNTMYCLPRRAPWASSLPSARKRRHRVARAAREALEAKGIKTGTPSLGGAGCTNRRGLLIFHRRDSGQ